MPIADEQIMPCLKLISAIITDSHIVYTSGKHGSAYINKDAIYPYPKLTSLLCETIAQKCKHLKIQTVIAPAIGAVILSQWTAFHLSDFCRQVIHAIYAEKDENNSFIIKRGYDKYVTGQNILVVEDVLNTGGSARKVVEAVRKLNGQVVCVAALCNRGNVTTHDLGDVPSLISLANVQMAAWNEKDCPLCKQNVPINTEIGKGREYLARKSNKGEA